MEHETTATATSEAPAKPARVPWNKEMANTGAFRPRSRNRLLSRTSNSKLSH